MWQTAYGSLGAHGLHDRQVGVADIACPGRVVLSSAVLQVATNAVGAFAAKAHTTRRLGGLGHI